MKIKQIVPIGTDFKVLGTEMIWDDSQDKLSDKELRMTVMKCFNFYNNQCTEKDARKFVDVYLKSINLSKDKMDSLSSVSDSSFYGAFAWLCRMNLMGFKMRSSQRIYFDDKLAALVGQGKMKSIERKKSVSPNVINIQQRIMQAVNATIGELDYQIDTFIKDGFKSKFKAYDWMKETNLKQLYASKIVDIYTKELKELVEAQKGKDEQLVEGYSNMNASQLKKLIAFYESIINDAKTWSSNLKKVQTPRKRKTKTADQQTKRLQYMKSFDELRMASIDPNKLIGAETAWLYNTKTRVLMQYVSADRGGLSIKGTTLQNYNETESKGKKIRKPEDIVKNIVNGGVRVSSKYFKELKSKEQTLNGRINSFCIILKA